MPKYNPKKAQKVRDSIKRWDDQWKVNTAHYHEMTTFVMGDQWREDEAKLFEDYKKMPLTVNKLATQMNHLLGQQRQNTPNLQIEPGDDVEEQTAEVRAALIKDISLNSHARQIYQTIFEQMVCGGYSASRIGTRYVSNKGFEQEIIIASFKDPTKCYWDPGAESPCKTDGLYSGYRTVMSRKMFRSKWGAALEKKIAYETTDVTDSDSSVLSFSDENSITVIDHYERKSKLMTLYQLSNGESLTRDELDELEMVEMEGHKLYMYKDDYVTIANSRTFPEYYIIHSKWAGDYELESAPFHSEQLPILFADQHSYYDKNGKQVTRSFWKDARDSQRYLNYLRTETAYRIKVSRSDQFIGARGNAKAPDTQNIWKDPAVQQGLLFYDEVQSGAKPEQLRPSEISQSLIQQFEAASRDIQDTTGMFDTQMGDQGNENSGDAIDARTERGSFNTYIPFNSLNRVIACSGEIIDEMIPYVYDTERTLRLDLKDKGNTKVTLNQRMDDYGVKTANDMTQGQFRIRLVPGASYEDQQRESLQSMDLVLSKNPEIFASIMDLYAENLQMPNNIEIRNRLRAMVDPAVIKAGKTGEPLPPKPQQQDPMIALKQQEIQLKMQQSQMQAQQKMQELNLKEQQLMMDSHNAGVNYATEVQKLEAQKQEVAAKLANDEKAHQAEMARISLDAHKTHSNNFAKILTHNPTKPFKDEAIQNDTTNR